MVSYQGQLLDQNQLGIFKYENQYKKIGSYIHLQMRVCT